ncbi:MAG: aspartate carbamoyltransferase catalytic subunit [Actinobacteria bacterium]|uniref:aspartate carbamoyltransferase n=1 Tax=freshwater metagenome TaxID=449393 RepID=A0A6J7ENE4_9ZZZZ|nr:aspartate carbamoyltransferase catalytic subunit [Actinomycetota bacterium]
MKHLLGIEELGREGIERILDRAESFEGVASRDIQKVPALRGRLIVNLFYEASTRTTSSFELAAKRLSADVISVRSSGSSVEKGESLKDTIATLDAYEPAAIVVRHPRAGAAHLVSKWTRASVINAGDGAHAHPTQALLDVHTLRGRIGALDGRNIWIVGDISHSRVARSTAKAFSLMGARVTLAGPPTLLPPGIGVALGCEEATTLAKIGDADIVYALRMQHERMTGGDIPSLAEYSTHYAVTEARLRPDQLVMHPGPVNRGVEIGGDVVDSGRSLIAQQVAAGVAVRMAVLYELLAGAEKDGRMREVTAA